MPAPTVKVSVTDIENGTVQSAGLHGHTYPTPIAVTGMTTGGSGSQSFNTANTSATGVSGTGSKSHHHE